VLPAQIAKNQSKKERVAFKKNSKNNNNPHAESGGEYD
jgi:hypothetical protein